MYVRDYYIRRKGNPGKGSSGEAAKKRCELLSFLDSCASMKRTSISNVSENEPAISITEEEQDSYVSNEYGTSMNDESDEQDGEHGQKRNDINVTRFTEGRETKKKKISRAEERLNILKQIAERKDSTCQNEPDEIDLFFSSIAKTVKTLPRQEQIKLKMEISSMVGNAELSLMTHEN